LSHNELSTHFYFDIDIDNLRDPKNISRKKKKKKKKKKKQTTKKKKQKKKKP